MVSYGSPMGSQPLRTLIVALLVANAIAWSQAAEPVGAPLTLDEVRAAGRAKSLFLKEAEKKFEATPAIPTANLDHFRKSIAPILAQKCIACHGPELTNGNLRIDK